jgi:transposase
VLIKTLLNFVEKHKGFVYCRFKLLRDRRAPELHIWIRPAQGCQGLCSQCERPGPTYDTLQERLFQFVPLWGILVFFVYAMRRIDCATCKTPVVEKVPWAQGKQRITKSFAWFLAGWAKRMSWKEVARAFRVTWDTVYSAVDMAVKYGLEHRTVDDVTAIGVDEVMWQKGDPKFLTVVYSIGEKCKRLLWVGRDRKEETLEGFFDWFGDAKKQLYAVASDMWRPYMNVIQRRVPWAFNVLDRFHMVANVHKAVDEVRASEARELEKQGKEVLRHKRWLLLKAPENLTQKQAASLKELVKANLKSVRAYLLKEDLRQLWDHTTVTLGGAFLLSWCRRAKASKLAPLARIAKTFEKHLDLILNWFRVGGAISSGAVEGLNNKLKVIVRRSYGFRSYDVTTTALYHTLGHLPEPPLIHRFC